MLLINVAFFLYLSGKFDILLLLKDYNPSKKLQEDFFLMSMSFLPPRMHNVHGWYTEGIRFHGTRFLVATTWVLEIEPGSSGRGVSFPNC